jgi:hypothetical protein
MYAFLSMSLCSFVVMNDEGGKQTLLGYAYITEVDGGRLVLPHHNIPNTTPPNSQLV